MKKYISRLSFVCVLIQSAIAINPQKAFATDVNTINITSEQTKDIFVPQDPFINSPKIEYSKKNAPLAGALNLLIPGSGHYYIGDYSTGSKYLAVSLSFVIYSKIPMSTHVSSNFNMYSAYAGYRDARALHAKSDYRYEMPQESLVDLIKAPFQFSTLKKPEVCGALIASLVGASILSGSFKDCSAAHLSLNSYSSSLYPLLAFPVGIGEEALFRGYIQSGFMEMMPAPHAIALSSAIFGLAHVGNANGMSHEMKKQYYYKSIPWITLLGGYMGYLTHKNHSLKESTALHAWYDFTLFLGATIASQAISADTNPNQEFVYATSFDF